MEEGKCRYWLKRDGNYFQCHTMKIIFTFEKRIRFSFKPAQHWGGSKQKVREGGVKEERGKQKGEKKR